MCGELLLCTSQWEWATKACDPPTRRPKRPNREQGESGIAERGGSAPVWQLLAQWLLEILHPDFHTMFREPWKSSKQRNVMAPCWAAEGNTYWLLSSQHTAQWIIEWAWTPDWACLRRLSSKITKQWKPKDRVQWFEEFILIIIDVVVEPFSPNSTCNCKHNC